MNPIKNKLDHLVQKNIFRLPVGRRYFGGKNEIRHSNTANNQTVFIFTFKKDHDAMKYKTIFFEVKFKPKKNS